MRVIVRFISHGQTCYRKRQLSMVTEMNSTLIITIKNTLQKYFSENELALMAEELGFTVRHRPTSIGNLPR
ncbi:hypothetical protein [Endozoicomonas euniceicola]|uniref:Transposase n=1 Tax=Endozoicomonas euniceicola TaxID=1234143 RepID=A0ABY6GWB5_9GAMM|nr:hypothetical protein [Endozoicomonas euniceicola]UYM16965.1 hypothetical protein NX720_03305 [Endozoicomonas euniceicola]